MAAVTPSSDLYLLQCPIEIDNKNQINFANTTTQYNYFFGLNKIGATNFSYQRKDSTIRYPAHIDSIRHFNYVMYRNDNYSNKWFYAFIEEMEYLNDSTTLIKIKTDVYQTWQFDLTFKRCFVEREHVNDDTAGKHTLDEGLSVGEPMMNTNFDYKLTSYQAVFVAQVTQLPDGVNPPSEPTYQQRVYNSIPQGCYFIIMNQASSLAKFSRWYDKKGKQNAIVSMFIVPGNLVLDAVFSNYTIGEGIGSTRLGFMPSTFGASNIATLTAYRSSTLNGYTPKNNKLFTYPYMYLTVSNNSGSNGVYKYEDFVNPSETKWKVVGALTQGGSIKVYPEGYKNAGTNMAYDYGISWGKYPIISWSSDFYLNWQAQNGTNEFVKSLTGSLRGIGEAAGGAIGLAQVSAGTSQAGGSSVSSLVGGVMDVADNIRNAMQEQHIAQLTPDMAKGNINCGDINYSMNKTCVTFACMSCRREYAVMIDSFFSMFGYKVNEVKVPNITGRSNWNFVKTKQCNVLGNIPQEDLDEIKTMFDSGITIWHKTAYFLDYSQNNPIV